jgi:hypothetical protein
MARTLSWRKDRGKARKHSYSTLASKRRRELDVIIAKLRQVDVLVSQGQSFADAIRQIGVTEITYYRWHQIFYALKEVQVIVES